VVVQLPDRAAADGVVAPHAAGLGRWGLAALLMLPLTLRTLLRQRKPAPRMEALLVLGALGMWICGALVYHGGQSHQRHQHRADLRRHAHRHRGGQRKLLHERMRRAALGRACWRWRAAVRHRQGRPAATCWRCASASATAGS
jgi:hypothetical protein